MIYLETIIALRGLKHKIHIDLKFDHVIPDSNRSNIRFISKYSVRFENIEPYSMRDFFRFKIRGPLTI